MASELHNVSHIWLKLYHRVTTNEIQKEQSNNITGQTK